MKFTKKISLLLVGVLGLSALVACGKKDPTTEAEETTYVSLRINPEIELLADEDGDVITANAINEDGEVVLSTIDLEGKSIEEAGEIFTETANELGYLTPNGEKDTVYVEVQSTIDGEEADLEEKLDKTIRDYFNNNGINGKVSPETLDKYADKAENWNISVGHTKLVMRVLDSHPELTDTDVLGLSVKELMGLLKGKEKIAASLQSEYNASVKALRKEYAQLFKLQKEIDDLNKQLDKKITEEEKTAIQTQIAEKEAEMQVLQETYTTELNEVKEAFLEASREIRAQYQAEAEQRKKNKQ